ncbi:hypothetical protein [Hydrocarboniphaga effusa]|jgi:hypothetical protein|uniref:hypothetical protein n=1 Tax=Hydrocarboniphaga effusa TaxID=243629 RepID=UPI0035B39079
MAMLKMEGVQKIYRTDLDQKRKQRQSEASRCAVAVAVDVQPWQRRLERRAQWVSRPWMAG